ncbi:MAG: M20 family metallopeptidase [Enterococcus sp.]
MLATYRKELHQIPEIGFHEFKTSAYIYNELKEYGAKIHKVGATGIVVYFDKGKEHTIAFRADMDALPVTEKTKHAFPSLHQGHMHACGHDGHMAILLGLAKYLADTDAGTLYNVVLIFQPSEEISGGAQSILDAGILERYKVEAIFGFHLWPGLPKGEVYSRPGPLMAQSSETDLIITGRSAHIASSHLGIDSLQVCTEFLYQVYQLDRQLKMDHLLKFGTVTGGRIRNVLADEVIVQGSIRSYQPEHQKFIKKQLAVLASEVSVSTNAQIQICYNDGYPPVINDRELYQCFQDNARLKTLVDPVLQAEDFGVYTQDYRCVFFFLGVGDTAPLHAADFDFDMDVLEYGLAWYEQILMTPGLSHGDAPILEGSLANEKRTSIKS